MHNIAEFPETVDTLDAHKFIIVKGARVHNLKNIDVAFPRNKLIVVTGVSGSGKSSLVFDTLYAEGQRRYVESLSAYARQFMGRMNKPDVDYIKGIAPAMAIEQKVNTKNPRSTVGTSTEIYDYLKLLFARVGRTFSPVSGKEVKRHSVTDIVDFIMGLEEGAPIQVLAAIRLHPKSKGIKNELQVLLQKGFTRIIYKEQLLKIEDFLEQSEKEIKKPAVKKNQEGPVVIKDLYLLVDRFAVSREDEELPSRIGDSAQTALVEGEGECILKITAPGREPVYQNFSNKFEADGILFEEPSVNFFSFNNPYGACKTCEGFGSVIGIDIDLVIPDKSLSVYEGAIAPWRGEKMKEWQDDFIRRSIAFDFPMHRSYFDLNEAEKNLLWEGNKSVQGINAFFKYVEEQTYKIQYRVMLSRYRGKTACPDCRGSRLRKDTQYVKLVSEGKGKQEMKSLPDILLMPVDNALEYFRQLHLNEHDQQIAGRILLEINNRFNFLHNVGLGYLSMNRLSSTLSGGESQRINLATSLGSSLVGSMYILDEPSIGLHPRDTSKLITVLKSLKSLGNTVIVVEHEEDIMQVADEIIDIGPLAGVHGGHLVFQGSLEALYTSEASLTGKYLSGRMEIALPKTRRKWSDFIEITGARENNLKNVNVKFPLHVITAVTGVSGSGKTSLIKAVLYPALKKHLGVFSGEKTGTFDKISGDLKKIKQVELVDQNPIGKSSRSNPVTYVKAYDSIRDLYAEQPLSKARGYKSSHFSFNVDSGRCEVCKGEGEVLIEMQFMADIHLECESCRGKRFREEILEVKYNNKNIADVLDLSIDEAMEFFADEKNIIGKIRTLAEVGLGYIRLGQSSSTLSGGEAQRIKLASFLGKGSHTNEHILFIFDEPTTGLHFHDIRRLLDSFEALIKQGHSILLIEHNLEVIKCADWVIDLGPEGGQTGGNIVFEGTPEALVNVKESYTGKYLADKLK
jgi:excinuclease ABC subunit A